MLFRSIAFNEQFDMYTSVIWEPYTEELIQQRYPGGISTICTRDRAYWMTKSKIIFDVFVEEMSQQRVMRQFGLRQLVDPPPVERPLPDAYHRYVESSFFSKLFALNQYLLIEHSPKF